MVEKESLIDPFTQASLVPRFIRNGISYLVNRHKNLDVALILQLSSQEKQDLKDYFLSQAGKKHSFENITICNENVACALLRVFFTELPDCLLNCALFSEWLDPIGKIFFLNHLFLKYLFKKIL